MLTVALLGAVEVRDDGSLLAVPAGRTTELLVRLALARGVRVRTDALLEDLWGGAAASRNTLQSKVSQLRRALGSADLVRGIGDGYLLAVEPHQVDVGRAIALAAEASAALEGDASAEASARALEGLSLFRGDVLMECGDWAVPYRVQLEEVRLTLVEVAMTSRTDLGAGGELIGELEALVTQHPLRERLWASLITALYRSGRQAEALTAYARVRTLLVEELGVEPGPELRDLEAQVLRQGPRVSNPRPHDALVRPGNLPERAAELVGRDGDVARVMQSMDDHRLVTLVGTAGIGKTACALAAAQRRHLPGGVWLIRLEGLDGSADLRNVVAGHLHVSGGEAALLERLSGAQTLLLLDNCEHVVEAVAALVSWLQATVPSVRFLLTSQVPLRVDGESVHHLAPLEQADAVTLFATRAKALRPRFALDDRTTDLVGDICRSLDGLPLAIELAAGRARSMSVPDIARRLDDRFTLLRDPSSTDAERRRALAGAIGWSYDLLFPDDQRGLWALSCFAGGATLDAVEHVLLALGVPPAATVDVITRLVDRSLVEVDTAVGGDVRYRLLDSIATFAGARLEDSDGTLLVRAAHAAWYADMSRWCQQRVRTAEQPMCLRLARAERDNLDAALAWCNGHDPTLGAEIATRMGWTWVVMGEGAAGAARLRKANSVQAEPRHRLEAHLLAGWLEASAGDVTLAEQDLVAARRLAVELADARAEADVDRHGAFLALQQGRPDLAATLADRSIEAHQQAGQRWEEAASRVLAAYAALMQGDTSTAAREAAGAAEILTPIDDAWGLVHAQGLLAGVAQAEGRLEDAVHSLREAAEKSRLLGFPGQAALHLANLGDVERHLGNDRRAARTLRRAIGLALAGGDGRLAATARLRLAQLLRAEGDAVAAIDLLERNVEWYAHAGGGDGALLSRCLLAAETRDEPTLASVLDQARRMHDVAVQVHALDARARHAALDARSIHALSLLEQADAAAARAPTGVPERERHDKRQALLLLAAVGAG
jgi:predicted ATPase/DNA-binding SARP family transcriptional activator